METPGGDYVRVRAINDKPFSAQDFFMRLAEGRDSVDNIPGPAAAPAAEAQQQVEKPQRRRAVAK
jgi:hypothetical protein